MEFLKLAVSFVVPFILYMIMKHVVYLFTARGTIRALELATVELQSLKKVVETEINKAKPENRAPTNEAQEWLSQVETLVKEAEEIQQNYRQLCWCSWSISPNFHAIHNISRSAAVKHVEVKSLCDKKANIEVLTVHPPPLLTHEMPASSSTIEAEETMNILPPPAHKTQAYASKLSKLESALHFVKDDVHGIIGIWGMGGVGKTHLLKQINNELSRDPEFNVVVFITCSKHCSEEKVQNEIIDNLRLDKSGSTKQKQSTIHNFLKERSFVLLLDDLWNHVDLDTIGIPDPLTAVEACKRKIVLTTRSTEVCEQMEVNKRLRVDVLNWDDAWALFQEQVSKEIIDCDPMVQKFAVIIVKELGGLPLALITVGRAMCDKADCNEWEKAVELLKEARLNDVEFSQANQSVFHTLRFSYDSLKNDTLKQCFLHCALWPEDHPIQKNDLIELWMGLGLIDEPNIQAAYNVGYNYIRTLQAICLLEIHDDYTIDGDGTLKMHDVIRDMALWIANSQGADLRSWNVQAGTYKKAQKVEIFSYTEKLSIMNNYEGNISLSITCSSTKVSTMILSQNNLNNSKTLRLELFPKLTFLNLYNNRLETFPLEICKLAHLQYLNLSHNPLKSLPELLADLTNLKYLLLRGIECTFPKGVLSKLKSLRVLDLSDCYPDDYLEIFPTLEKDLQYLPNFQALGITIWSIPVFKKFSQIVNVPVRWLDICNYEGNWLSFSSCFLGNSQLQNNLLSLKLRASNSVESVEFESESEHQSICHLERLEQLYFEAMWNMKEVLWKSLDPKDVFPRLEVVEFNACHQLTSISWIINLPRIQELRVLSCYSMKQLICIDELKSSEVNVSEQSFPFLKIMYLYYGYELGCISDPMITFPALEYLEVDDCDKLKKLPFRTGNPPRNLKKILGTEEWWNNVEMDDSSHRTSLEPIFKRW